MKGPDQLHMSLDIEHSIQRKRRKKKTLLCSTGVMENFAYITFQTCSHCILSESNQLRVVASVMFTSAIKYFVANRKFTKALSFIS